MTSRIGAEAIYSKVRPRCFRVSFASSPGTNFTLSKGSLNSDRAMKEWTFFQRPPGARTGCPRPASAQNARALPRWTRTPERRHSVGCRQGDILSPVCRGIHRTESIHLPSASILFICGSLSLFISAAWARRPNSLTWPGHLAGSQFTRSKKIRRPGGFQAAGACRRRG